MSGEANPPENHLRVVGVLAGVASGLTKVAVGHSFDTIKTRLQCSPAGMYNGALDCLSQTVRREGVLALYKGATPPALGWAAIDSVLLGSLHNYRLFLIRTGLSEPKPGSDSERLSILGHGIAGLFAGWTSAPFAHPIELLKIKLQMQTQRAPSEREFTSPLDCAKKVVRAQGVQGLWRGLPAGFVYRSSFFWLFSSFELLMRGFTSLKGTQYEMSTGLANFLAGGLGSLTFWGLGLPADNVKNRIMAAPLVGPRLSAVTVAWSIYSRAGWRGFYAGFWPCITRAFPVNASAFFVYEGLMRLLGAEKTRS